MPNFDLLGTNQTTFDAAGALATRVERVKPFVKRHEDFAPDYVLTQALATAMNVALSLGRPLLLTGEPGSGKTLAAYWLAWRLGLGKVLAFDVKSDSRARDLCYQFDAVSWYRKSQLAAAAGREGDVSKYPDLQPGPLGRAFGWVEGRSPRDVIAPTNPATVLIDEIDKAPRDFPNDLLLELDQMEFQVVETGDKVVCNPDMRPIIVITSNAERRLPDPFLRRCVVHRIELDDVTVTAILKKRMQGAGNCDDSLVDAATRFWLDAGPGLSRKPTIDEFWRWLSLATGYGGKSVNELTSALQSGGPLVRSLPFISMLFSEQDLDRLSNQA